MAHRKSASAAAALLLMAPLLICLLVQVNESLAAEAAEPSNNNAGAGSPSPKSRLEELKEPAQQPLKPLRLAPQERLAAPATGAPRAPPVNRYGAGSGAGSSSRQLQTVEKLKRGLSNFMNRLNPAPFFVPALSQTPAPASGPPPKGAHLSSGASERVLQMSPLAKAELPTIVNSEPSAESLIKGPTRLMQTWASGGPGRWGRR